MRRFVTLPPREVWPYVAGVLAFAAAARLGLGSQALSRVGLSTDSATLNLAGHAGLQGNHVARACDARRLPAGVQRAILRLHCPFVEDTAGALSVGGALLPLGVSIYATVRCASNALDIFNASIFVVGVVELVRLALLRAHVARSVGPIAPVIAWLLGWTLPAEHRAALVLASGFVAVLATMDLPLLSDLQTIGAPEIVIGGEESFGPIFLNYTLSLLFT